MRTECIMYGLAPLVLGMVLMIRGRFWLFEERDFLFLMYMMKVGLGRNGFFTC